MPLGYNRVLGDQRRPVEARSHRIALGNWPASIRDRRTETLDALLSHVITAGYDGVEFGIDAFARYFPEASPAVVAAKARLNVEARGLRIFGATLHTGDEAARRRDWLDGWSTQVKLVQDMGGEYIGHQFNINADYAGTGGLYREDVRYLQWCADRVAEARDAAWQVGLNYYLEVHVDRITEDPAALCRLLELCTCELNGDLSHYFARGFTRGRLVEKVLHHVGHTHVRMARMYGDLSAAVDDPKADWQSKGVTWGLFQFMKPCLAAGFSSRVIVGETGPMHLVKDTLTQDAALVPLYRAMARFADAAVQGIVMKVEDPGDLRPWG
ncbi:MAG: hypothetical protein WD042_10140 [Phycisphaeraceae bacterium]